MVAEVVKLETAADIPRTMRMIADQIEAGEHGEVKFVVAAIARKDGAELPEVFCWGTASNLEIMGAFSVAHHRMLTSDDES